MSSSKRSDALRRLGGPVCPVCDAIGVEIEVRFVNENGRDWLKDRGKIGIVREGLAPLCRRCSSLMDMEHSAKELERRRKEEALKQQMQKDADWMVRLGGQNYHHACADHQDDLAAAEEIAAGWGIGNSLFGRRPRE
jgi:hypothetical protein